jgi:hypothetical protein
MYIVHIYVHVHKNVDVITLSLCTCIVSDVEVAPTVLDVLTLSDRVQYSTVKIINSNIFSC